MKIVARKQELAWAAGFFDGEGYCGRTAFTKAKGGKKYYRWRADISQVHKEPLERFLKVIGHGKIYGPYTPKSLKSRPYFVWCAEGPNAKAAVKLLAPWLSSPKLQQAEELLK